MELFFSPFQLQWCQGAPLRTRKHTNSLPSSRPSWTATCWLVWQSLLWLSFWSTPRWMGWSSSWSRSSVALELLGDHYSGQRVHCHQGHWGGGEPRRPAASWQQPQGLYRLLAVCTADSAELQGSEQAIVSAGDWLSCQIKKWLIHFFMHSVGKGGKCFCDFQVQSSHTMSRPLIMLFAKFSNRR